MNEIDANTRVTVITVTYNSADVVGDMLSSVPPQVPVVIVDNSSGDRPRLREIVEKRGGHTRLLENAQNIGFGSACNEGAKEANTEFLLFLNPDAALASGALQELVRAADRSPNAVGFNPRIQDKSGRPILKRRSDLVGRSKWLPRGTLSDGNLLPVLSGAALFTRRADFEAVGGFDPNIFLFFEDDDLSLRLSDRRGDLIYVDRALVEHIGGASSGGSKESERLKNWHWGHAQIYTLRKHGLGQSCPGAFAKKGFRPRSPATLPSPKPPSTTLSRAQSMSQPDPHTYARQ